MSFILDALKKSEAERLRKDAPGFSNVPDSTHEKSASHWIWIAVVLIGINVTILVVMFMKPDRVQDPVTSSPAAESASVLPSKSASAAGLPQTLAEAERPRSPAAGMSTDNVSPAVTAADQHAGPVPAVASYETPLIIESYATFNDLRVQGLLQLPDLHLDIHVYSNIPEDRFVFVNMSKYKERGTLDEGPVVREITPDGVILEYLGTGFLLPRE